MESTETALAPRSNGATALVPSSFEAVIKFAEMMARASLVPQHLQGKPADCLLVIEQAQRWGLSPFAVAQCTSVIQGRLMFEGKLVAAVVNARGELERRLDYRYEGDSNGRRVIVSGKLRGEKEPREVEVRLADVRTNNRMWQAQPDQQLAYHGARVWARRHMPELMLGVYSPEEFAETADYTPPPKAQSSTDSAKSASPSSQPPAPSTAPASAPNSNSEDASDDELMADDEDSLEEVPIYENRGSKQRPEWVEVGRAEKRTKKQNNEIHALRHELRTKFTDATFRTRLMANYGKSSSADLSKAEAQDLVGKLREYRDKQRRTLEERTRQFERDLVDAHAEDMAAARESAGANDPEAA